ncbi:hypothetical protein FE257_010030 [Aspergillus nanangensis]|uniref:Major facilitator superfamily (MFS) profile domain-containing protein n=1 Tax=Aspergillus nanangensis TaxID=2582783 RepID=A0AAD4GYK9_ASPNN|nr:hypothetical protein FE257_010030 [Aspergillus nanangensis]
MGQVRISSSSAVSKEEVEKSEHSIRGWLAILGSFAAFFCSVGFINAFGVFQDYYRAHQLSAHSDFDISWIGSFATFMLFGCGPLAGILVDRKGPTLPLVAGSLGMLVAIFMTSLCSQYYQFFLAQALLLGASMAFLVCPAIATVSRYFRRNKGMAMGLTVSGSSLGGIVWPIVINELLNKDNISFGWTIRIIGFIMLPLLLLALLTIVSPQAASHPELTAGEEDQSTQGRHQVGKVSREQVYSLVKTPAFLLLCAGLAISYLGMFSPFFYVTSYARSLGHSTSFAFYLVSIVNAASFFGRILPGILADRYGHFNLCSLAVILSGIIAFCWTAAEGVAALVIWSLAYGLTSGAIMSLQAACAAHLTSPELQGTSMGLILGSVAITALFGTPISGQLVGSYSYLALSMYAGACLVVGGALIFCARLKLNGQIFARQ